MFLFLAFIFPVSAWQLVSGPISPNQQTGSDTRFGYALCLEGTTLGIGAVNDDYYYDYQGAAGAIYVANEANVQSKLIGNGQKPRALGYDCTFSDGLLVAGAPEANQVLTWTTAIDPPEIMTGGGNYFGRSMDGFQDYLMIGSTTEVRYYRRRQNNWQLRDTRAGVGYTVKFTSDGFWAIATSGTEIQVFERRNQRLRPRHTLTTDVKESLDAGETCFIVGDKFFGAPGLARAEIYEYDGTTWNLEATLTPPDLFGFGKAVTISNACDQAVACGQDTCYDYAKINGQWAINSSFTVKNVNSVVSTPGFDRLYVGNIIIGGKYYIYE